MSAITPSYGYELHTFADWHEPPPDCIAMDFVAHCGEVNRASYVRSLDANRYRVPPRLYGASGVFVNFSASFKLDEKHDQGARITKRNHPCETPCAAVVQAATQGVWPRNSN
jgi:hypothetical protein